MQFEKLPEDARSELPAADTPYKKYRGTLAWWVIGIMLTIIITISVKYDGGRGKLLDDKDRVIQKLVTKNDSLQNVITEMLKQRIYELQPAVQKARQTDIKTDSIIQNIKP